MRITQTMAAFNFIKRKLFTYGPFLLLVMLIISTLSSDRAPKEINRMIHAVKSRITLPPIRFKGSRTVNVVTSLGKNIKAPPPGENIQYELQQLANRVFYNRVPKCGSRAVQMVVRKLARRLKYKYVSSRVYSPHYLVNQTELEFIEEFVQRKTPLLYDRHLHYVDFERYSYESPVYINLMREPFDRLVSAYYYLQEKFREKRKSQYGSNMTFDECVEKRLGACVSTIYTFKQVPFFCGHNPICRVPSQEAVIRAKHNIVRQYLVVGMTENMTHFFKALEALLPNFFKSAPKLFRRKESLLSETFRGKNRKESTAKSRDALLTDLMYDTDLYKWTRQRFYILYRKLMGGKR